MADRIDQLTIGSTSYDIALPADSKDTMFYTTASSTANAFTVTIPDVQALYDGLAVNVKFNAATASGATLNVNSLGAKGIYYRTGSAITSHISANNYVTLVYNSTAGGSNTPGWVMQYAYDSNSNSWRNITVDGVDWKGTGTGTGALNFVHGSNVSFTTNGNDLTIAATNDNQTIKGNGTAFGANDAVNIIGSGAVSVTADTTNKKITISAPSVTDTNQKVKADSVTFGADDVVNFIGGGATTVTGNATNKTITISTPSVTDTNQKVKAGSVTFDANDVVNFEGSGIVSVTGDATNDKITISASHQSIKTLDTTATSEQSTSSSEAITGSGTITLHKVSKTGKYSDLSGPPTIGNATLTIQKNGTTVNSFSANATSNVTANISVPVNFSDLSNRGEAFLAWGGQNGSGTYYPIDAAMVPELGANRLAFLKVTNGSSLGASVEYSRDGGTTWTDYGATEAQITNLFNGNGGFDFVIGKASTGEGNIATNQYQLRINVYTSVAQIYTVLNKFVILVSTSGTSNNWCTIRARYQSNYTSSIDTWTTFVTKASVSGWSGYNVINTSGITTYGNTAASQYGHLQFIFGCDTGSTNVNYKGLTILKIFGFGGVGWTTPSTLAKTGHMYTYDASKNVTFPATVSATTFSGSGASLTNLNASNLSSGTVPSGRLPAGSTSQAGILQLGTGASNAAQGNHTHTTTLATDSGTATVTLAHDTTYKLTAGGTSVIFKTPTGGGSTINNLQDGSGTGAIQEIQDGSGGTFDFTNKNPHATAIDSTLTGNITFGGIGNYSASLGGKSQASGKRAVAQGTTTVAKGNYSHAEGDNSVSLGADSHAEGYQTVSYGGASHAEGTATQSLGNNSHAEGNSTTTNSVNSHAEGYNSQTLASGTAPTIPAYDSQSSGGGTNPGEGGTSTTQTGDGAHAEGSNTRALGNFSHAEGTNTWAGGLSSHAEGYGSQALYDYAHAEGYNTQAVGFGAHSTGVHTVASGNYSFTQGQQTTASANCAAAFGQGTTATTDAQIVVGKYNATSYTGTPLFTVGCGSSSSPSNAFVVHTDGTSEFKDYIDIGKYSAGGLFTRVGQGYITLRRGSGSETPAYIEFTGYSGNSGVITLRPNGNSGTNNNTLYLPRTTGTLAIDDLAVFNTKGLVKPAYSTTGTASLTTTSNVYSNSPTIQARSTDSSRYYAVEIDSAGRLFVNVPWSNSTSYLSYTQTSGTSSSSYYKVVGKTTTLGSPSGTNYGNNNVYFDGNGNLYATTFKLNGSATSSAPASTDAVATIQYDSTNQCIKFIFN